ncbi:MAG: GntG family PLP-dependent aldolase [Candidatus Kariarchaeaceae archaeon]|jgi:threonine aldolase
MKKVIDLRSDTVTHPTEEMREAAANARLGDDVFGDDPTVIELEEYAAKLLGKEKALFVSSGTQGNLVSLLAQTTIGDEIIVEQDSHIYFYEVGGMAAVGGAIPRPIPSEQGYIAKASFDNFIRPENVHFPRSSLFCIENTHNRHGGMALSASQVKEMAEMAHSHGMLVHLDGARIFNAVSYHNEEVTNYTKHVDSVQVCLSKGLSAPVGSIVAGTEDFIYEARRKRKMLGGGMRQAGIIAAPGLIALREMRDRLVIDHINARNLAEGLTELGIDVWPTQTNIVVCDIRSILKDSSEAVQKLEARDILAVPFDSKLVRMTTHRHITETDIEVAIQEISKVWFN